MRYTYLVGTEEELNEGGGQEFSNLSDAYVHRRRYSDRISLRYSDNNDLLILELQWEFSDSELIK